METARVLGKRGNNLARIIEQRKRVHLQMIYVRRARSALDDTTIRKRVRIANVRMIMRIAVIRTETARSRA